MLKITQFVLQSPLVKVPEGWAKRIILPGFDGLSIFDAGNFFVRGLRKGTMSMRASFMAFNFLLALFPTVIFLFSLIPYVPIANFQEELLTFIRNFLPKNEYEAIRETIEDIIRHQRGGLLSFGFLSALFFSTNGINAMMSSFNRTYHSVETRSPVKQRWISFLLTIGLSFLVITAVVLLIFSEAGLRHLREIGIFQRKYSTMLFSVSKWIIILGLFFTTISTLYFFGPAKKKRFRFVSAGSTTATLLAILISIGFGFFVNNIASYNKLYGSIGTLIVVMLWLYLNSFILLIGFELNASLENALSEHEKKHYKKKLRSILRKSKDTPSGH